MIPDRAVLDSSVLIRATATGSTDARRWFAAVQTEEVRALAPELVYAELASALRKYVRVGSMTSGAAGRVLDTLLLVPLEIESLRRLAPSALGVSVARGLSAYDAFYVALADAADAPLVTADRRLAAATGRSILIE